MTAQNVLLFRKWDISQIEIKDPGLKTSISLKETTFPMDFGRSALKRFNKADVNIVERLVNKMMHFGKKYAKNTGRMAGKKIHGYNVAKAAFEIIYQKTGKNPIEILVRAVENSAPNEDTTRIVYGGTVYHRRALVIASVVAVYVAGDEYVGHGRDDHPVLWLWR